MEKENLRPIIENMLFPVTPLVNYSKIPIAPWSRKEYWICNESQLEELKPIYKIEVDRKTRGGTITGFALLTGKQSNIMVIDIDKNHGDGSVNGMDSFNELINDLSEEDKKNILNTFSVDTPNGGKHLYFKYKDGLKNKSNYAPGVDLRTDGGLIVVPTSKVRVKNVVKDYKETNKSINEMPQALFDQLKELDKFPKMILKEPKSLSNGIDTFTSSKYYKPLNEGAGRDTTLISWLGTMIKNNPNMRNKENLLPHAVMYNNCWFNPPLDYETIVKKVESVLKYALPSYCDEKGNVDNWELVQQILKDKPSYVKGNLWFIYNDKKGFYEYMELKEVQRTYFSYAINNKDRTATRSKSFAELLMLNAEDAKKINDEKNYINCINGVIDIENNKLLEHSSNYKLQVQFKANYTKDWEEKYNESKFKNFLETTLDSEDIKTMQQAFGLFLSPHAREVEKVFLLKGSGSNGKSVMFDIMESLIDKKYISGVGLGDFGQDFIISMMEGKHANIVRDDDFDRTIHKHFKSIATGEEVAVNRKNKDHVRLAFNTSMFFGLNGLPNSKDKSYGFFRRPIIIQFDNTFGSQREVKEGKVKFLKDPSIGKNIIENELDIVFNWAYEGLQIVKSNKWVIEQSEKSIREMEEYREETDTVYAFYKNYITELIGSEIFSNKLYDGYITFCSQNHIDMPVTIQSFGKQIKSFGIKQKRKNQGKVYINITTDLQRIYGDNNPFA